MSRGVDAAGVAARIRASRAFSATSTRAARDAAAAVEACAQAHAEDVTSLDAVQRTTGASASEGSVSAVVRELIGSARATSARLESLGASQHAAAAGSERVLETVAARAREVEAITRDARLLAINANVAATRLGHTGMAAAVIATRVQGFAAEMQHEARGIATLSAELLAALPVIASHSATLLARSRAFSERTTAQLAAIEGAQGAFTAEVAGDVAALGRRAAEALDHVGVVLTGLDAHARIERVLDRAAGWAERDEVDQAVEALDTAAQASIAAVSSLPDRLLALNAATTEQTEALARLAATFEHTGALGSASRELSQGSAEFVSFARRVLTAQRDAAHAAVESERRGRGAVEACRRLVLEARLLTLAVRVEAGRIGAQGVEMIPIAEQLAGFTGRLDAVVADVSLAVGALRGQLEKLEGQSRSLSVCIDDFAANAPHLAASLEQALHRATGEVGAVLVATRDRARALGAASDELVTCLQFQDRLTQELVALRAALIPPTTLSDKTFLHTKSEDGLSSGELLLF